MAEPPADDRLVWLDLEMTGLDIRAARDRRDRGARHRQRTWSRSTTASTSSCTSRPRRSPRWTTSCGRCTRSRRCSRQIEASTTDARRRRRAGRWSTSAARAGRRHRAAVRQHDRRRPPVPRPPSCPSSTSYLHYRSIDVSTLQGAVPALVPGRSTRSGRAKTETHRALADIRESIAELRYYRENDAATDRPTELQPSAQESRNAPRSVVDRALRAPVAHEADAPAPCPANSPSPPPTSMP